MEGVRSDGRMNGEPIILPRLPQEFDYESSLDQFDPQKFNFYIIKTTEVTETGFPVLPPALSSSSDNIEATSIITTPKCSIPLRTLTDNYEEILIRSIKAFLRRCFNYTDKRRRSSRICKHKPGIKHYCRRKNWDTILSQYKTEVLDNPWVDLKTFYRENSDIAKKLMSCYEQSSRNHITEVKELSLERFHNTDRTENNAEGSSSTTFLKSEAKPLDMFESPITSLLCEDVNTNDISSFLRIFGLKKIESHNEIKPHRTEELDEKLPIKIELVSPSILTKSIEPAIDDAINITPVCKTEHFDDSEVECVPADCENTECDGEYKTNTNNEMEISSKTFEPATASESDLENSLTNLEVNSNTEVQNEENIESVNISGPVSHECCCHAQTVKTTIASSETLIHAHSPTNIQNLSIDTVPRNGMWDHACSPSPQPHRNNETRLFETNVYSQNPSATVTTMPAFSGSYPVSPAAQPCFSRQMYTQSGGMNTMFSHFYGPPCIPGPIVASQIMSPVLAYNIFPMNNVMCASHPGLIPFQCNGSYVSTGFDCNSLHSPSHSTLPWTYYNQNGPLTQYHKPWVHQWVNVNPSTVAPCRVQANDINRIHLPCCTEITPTADTRLQPSAYFPSSTRNNIFLSNHSTADIFVDNTALKFPQERK